LRLPALEEFQARGRCHPLVVAWSQLNRRPLIASFVDAAVAASASQLRFALWPASAGRLDPVVTSGGERTA
jgi:hypothetical protein